MESKEALSLAQLSSFSVVRLRRELSERGLQVSGMKADLMHRLEICIKNEIDLKSSKDMVSLYKTSNENVHIGLSDEYVVLDAVEESFEVDSIKPHEIEVSNMSKYLSSDIDGRGNAQKRKKPKDAAERKDHTPDRTKKLCHVKAVPSNDPNLAERRSLGEKEKEQLMEVESYSGKHPTQQIKPDDEKKVNIVHAHKSTILNRKKMMYKDLKSSRGPSGTKQDELASKQPSQKDKIDHREKCSSYQSQKLKTSCDVIGKEVIKPNQIERKTGHIVEEKVSNTDPILTKLTDYIRKEAVVNQKSFNKEGNDVDQGQEFKKVQMEYPVTSQAVKSTKTSEIERNIEVGKSIEDAEYERTKASDRHQDGVVSKQIVNCFSRVQKLSSYTPIDRGFIKLSKANEKREPMNQPKISSIVQEDKCLDTDGNPSKVSFRKMQDEKFIKLDKLTETSVREQGGKVMEDGPGEKIHNDQASFSMSLSPHSTDQIPLLTLANDEVDIPTSSKDDIPLLTLIDDHAEQNSSNIIKEHTEVKSDSITVDKRNTPAENLPPDQSLNEVAGSSDEKLSLSANKYRLLENDHASGGEGEMPYFVDVILKEMSKETSEHLDEEISLHTNKPHSGRTDVVTFWCDLCMMKLDNPTIAMQHLQGRPHRIKLKLKSCNEDLQNEKVNASRSLELDADKGPSRLCTRDEDKMKCEDCGIVFETPFKAKWHFEGRKHAEVIAAKLKASLSSGIFSSLLSSSCSDSGSTHSNITGNETSDTTELKGILRKDKVSSRIHTLPTTEQMSPLQSNSPDQILKESLKLNDRDKYDTYNSLGQYPDHTDSSISSNMSRSNNNNNKNNENYSDRFNYRNDNSHCNWSNIRDYNADSYTDDYDRCSYKYYEMNRSSSTSINNCDVPRPQTNLYSCPNNEMCDYNRPEKFENRIDQSNSCNIGRIQFPLKSVGEELPSSEDLYDPFQILDDDDDDGDWNDSGDTPSSPSLPCRKKKPIVSYIVGSAGKFDAHNKLSSNKNSHEVVTYPEDCIRQPNVPVQESHDVNNNSGIDQGIIDRGLNFRTKSENQGRLANDFPSRSVADKEESEDRNRASPSNSSSYSESEGYKQKSQYQDNCKQPYVGTSLTGSTKRLKAMECRDFSGDDDGMENERFSSSSLSEKTYRSNNSDYRTDRGNGRRNDTNNRIEHVFNDRGRPGSVNLQRSQNQQNNSPEVIPEDYSRCSYTYPYGPTQRRTQNR